MKTQWKEVPRGDVLPQYAGIYATMNRAGEIVINAVTFKMLGAPKAFHVLFDAPNNRIGLKPTNPGSRNAYPTTASNNAGARRIRAYRLLKEYGLDLPHTLRFYDASIDYDGILVLDLRTARPCPRAAARPKDGEQGHNRER